MITEQKGGEWGGEKVWRGGRGKGAVKSRRSGGSKEGVGRRCGCEEEGGEE